MKNEILEKAIADVELIKKIIEKTQKDFSKVSNLFICIGLVNLFYFLFEQLSFYIRSIYGYDSSIYNLVSKMNHYLPIIGYICIFIYFYKKIKMENNAISIGMIKIWGIVLIGTQLISDFYTVMLPEMDVVTENILYRSKEIIIILPIIISLLMTGILTQKKVISIAAIIYTLIYFSLFASLKEVTFGFSKKVLISTSSLSIKIVMILGMIVFGFYLKKGRDYGNK